MTLTTGLGPVAATADATYAGRGDVLVAPRVARRRTGWLVPVLDLLVAGAAAVATAAPSPGAALPLFFVVLLAAWPVVVAVTGGYSRMSEDPYALRVRPLLAAGAGIATAAWATLTIAPHVADGQTDRNLATMTLLFAATASLTSIGVRLLLPLVSPQRPLSVILVGAEAEVRELLDEAGRPARKSFVPVAVCLADDDSHEVSSTADPCPVAVRHGVEENLLKLIAS